MLTWLNIWNRTGHWRLRYGLWLDCWILMVMVIERGLGQWGVDQYDAWLYVVGTIVLWFWLAVVYVMYKLIMWLFFKLNGRYHYRQWFGHTY